MPHVRLLRTNRAAFALAGLTLLLASPTAIAQQFVLFDVTFTFTKDDADNSKPSKSHYYVRGKAINPDRPKDWTAPVDYRNGTVHIRAEVIEKPAGGAPTTWTLCYIPNKGQKGGYGCTGTQVYKEKGIYERDVKMASFWQNDGIVWEDGIKEMHLVMKDDSGGSGHAHKRPDPERFFPTKMRITMIQVAKGSTYDPKLVPNLPRKDRKDDAKPGEPAGDQCAGCGLAIDPAFNRNVFWPGGLTAARHDEKPGSVKPLAVRDITEKLDGKDAEATAVEVTLEPGQASAPHRHPGPVLGYVIEGEYEWAIDDQPAKVLKAGDTFYEPTGCLHRVSKNPAAKGKTRVLAWVLHPRDAKGLVIPEKK
jgi:quercetin dioxygenase-like cupin family protein